MFMGRAWTKTEDHQALVQVGLQQAHVNASGPVDEGTVAGPENVNYMLEIQELFQLAVTKLRGSIVSMIDTADKDRDGAISMDEMVTEQPNHGKEIFSKLDVDGDGQATLQECLRLASDSIMVAAEKSAVDLANAKGHVLPIGKFRDDLEAIRNGTTVIVPSAMKDLSAGELASQQERREEELAALDVAESSTAGEGYLWGRSKSGRRRRDADWHKNVDPLECGPTDNKCKNLQKLGNRAAWKAGMTIFKTLTESDFCWRNHYDRGAGVGRWCKSGYSQGGLLCYKNCPSKYRRHGDHCWKDCPSKYPDDTGVACCELRWDVWNIRCANKQVKYYPGKGLTDSSVTTCPPDRPVDAAGLCYKSPVTDYSCTGTACNINCKSVMNTDCGAGACAASTESCTHNVISMIDGSISAVIDTAILVVSFGSSSGAKVAASAAQKAALKQAARGNMKRIAVRVGKKSFKTEYRRLVRRAAMKAVRDAVKGKATDHLVDSTIKAGIAGVSDQEVSKAMAQSGRSAEQLADTIVQQMSDQAKDFDFKNLDFTGVSAVVDAMDSDAPADKMAAAWLNMLSTIDPTGWLAAAANFAKPKCKSIYDELDKIDIEESALDSSVVGKR